MVGFLLEKISGETSEPSDLVSGQTVLRHLHRCGILHGDINRNNFIVKSDHKAILIDFEKAVQCSNIDTLQEEYARFS